MPVEVFTQTCPLSWGGNQARTQNIKTSSCFLKIPDSVLTIHSSVRFFSLFSSSSALSLTKHLWKRCILCMIWQEICYVHSQRCYLFSFHLCLLLLEQTLTWINSDSQEAVWLICFVLSTDLSLQLWAQIKLLHFLCAWIRHQAPCKSQGVSKSITESYFCTGNCLGMS